MIKGFGLDGIRDQQNFGGILRAAHCYGVDFINVRLTSTDVPVGRWLNHGANTPKAHRHLPVFLVDDLLAHVPYGVSIVVIETSGSVALPDLTHPKNAYYVLGPENGSVSDKIMSTAKHVVRIPGHNCMNLAATANVILYDRMAKFHQAHQISKIQSGE